MWGSQEWGGEVGTEEHLADDPVLLTVTLPQRHHLSPQDLVLPGEKGRRTLKHLGLPGVPCPAEWRGPDSVTSRGDMHPIRLKFQRWTHGAEAPTRELPRTPRWPVSSHPSLHPSFPVPHCLSSCSRASVLSCIPLKACTSPRSRPRSSGRHRLSSPRSAGTCRQEAPIRDRDTLKQSQTYQHWCSPPPFFFVAVSPTLRRTRSRSCSRPRTKLGC